MKRAGGFRYVVSHSIEPANAPYAGLAELYFHDSDGYDRFQELITLDGTEQWMDIDGMQILRGDTEMIGIPMKSSSPLYSPEANP